MTLQLYGKRHCQQQRICTQRGAVKAGRHILAGMMCLPSCPPACSETPAPAPAPAGGDLYQRLVRSGGLLAEADVCRDVVVPLLLTLTFLHASHLVHRCALADRDVGGWGCCAQQLVTASCQRWLHLLLSPSAAVPACPCVLTPSACLPHPFLPACPTARDIKPENIMFTADGGLRLGDFGLSIDARTERPTSRVGTLDYM
jgi:hypothetical protein